MAVKKTSHASSKQAVLFLLIPIGLFTLLSGFYLFAAVVGIPCFVTDADLIKKVSAIPGLENVSITIPRDEEHCWVTVKAHVQNKGDITFGRSTSNSWAADSNAIGPVQFPEENVEISGLKSHRDEFRRYKQTGSPSYPSTINMNYKILPFRLYSLTDVITKYDDIMKFKPDSSEPGLSEQDIPQGEESGYFIIYHIPITTYYHQ